MPFAQSFGGNSYLPLSSEEENGNQDISNEAASAAVGDKSFLLDFVDNNIATTRNLYI